jgi:HEAT repeat protein
LLGSFAKEESWDFCYEVAMDSKEHEMVRDTFALNLGHILNYCSHNEALIETLLVDIKSDQKDKRIRNLTAEYLGKSTSEKLKPLLYRLIDDEDMEVKKTAINALKNFSGFD